MISSRGAVKIDMLALPEIFAAVAAALRDYRGPVVLDPVMVERSGDPLRAEGAVAALVELLLPRADVLTLKLPRAARLLNREHARRLGEAKTQGKALLTLGAQAVVINDSHSKRPSCIDLLVVSLGVTPLNQPRMATRNTHGTGCSLSSAIAAELAKASGSSRRFENHSRGCTPRSGGRTNWGLVAAMGRSIISTRCERDGP